MRRFILLLFISTSTSVFGQPGNEQIIDSLLFKANRYISGNGKNETLAFNLFMQCALMGHAKSMNTVAIMYKKGKGVKANGREAAKWFEKAGEAGYANAWYQLGEHYKWMKPPDQDMNKAYKYFERGANDGDSMSEYLKGYMLYKGFGCQQNYEEAVNLFRKGAIRGMANSMYFLGLSFRNGYGVPVNSDSADFWLSKAVSRGSRQALQELNSPEAENSNYQDKELALKIRSIAAPVSEAPLNKYQRIEKSISSGIITGKYKGYIIKYDWSGEHVIDISTLTLDIYGEKGNVYGIWNENDTLRVPLAAKLTPTNIIFQQSVYSRTDHYSPAKPVLYVFREANLNWVEKNDTVFLAGNIQMFSPVRNEPHKPISVALTKVGKGTSAELIQFVDTDGKDLNKEELFAYPNPFKKLVTVNFKLDKRDEVVTQIVTLDGKIVYTNKSGQLDPGYYSLPLATSQLIPGVYLLILKYDNRSKTIKLVKE